MTITKTISAIRAAMKRGTQGKWVHQKNRDIQSKKYLCSAVADDTGAFDVIFYVQYTNNPFADENADLACLLHNTADALCDEVERLQNLVQELEGQHKALVIQNSLLRQRPDLPSDRIPVHNAIDLMAKKIEQLTVENAALRAQLNMPGKQETQQHKDQILYGIGDQEILDDTIDECIEKYLDGYTGTDLVVEVKEYRRVAAVLDPQCFLDDTLERLDQEYSSGSEYYTDATQTMLSASTVFCEAIMREYVPWNCEPTGKVHKINALEWIKENAPEWLSKPLSEGDGGKK